MSMMTKSIKKADQSRPVHGGVSLAKLRELRISRDAVIDFSVNINPLGPPPEVKDALGKLDISAYPDSESLELKEAVSRVTGAQLEQIAIGNGTMELIHLLAQLFLAQGKAAAILTPTFNEYEIATKRTGAKIILLRAEEKEGFMWDVSAVCYQILHKKPNLLFICNPNNPTGVYLKREVIEAFMDAVGKGFLVLDESYISFVKDGLNATELLGRGNIIILHSMTKNYALAGLRLGYALCPKEVASAILAMQPTWSVNAAAQAAGLAALLDGAFLGDAVRCVETGKTYLSTELQALGVEVLPAAANFLLVKVGNASVLHQRLLTKGICVRDCSSFGLPEYIRIGVRTLPECKRLIEALAEILSSEFRAPSSKEV